MPDRPRRRIDQDLADDLAGLVVIIASLTTIAAVIYAAVAKFWPGIAGGYAVMGAIVLYSVRYAKARDRRRQT
jgi:hypothetical protein